MSILQGIKRRFRRPVQEMAGWMGLEIGKAHWMSLQIKKKLQSMKNLETSLSATEELVRRYPQHPMAQLELARCYSMISDKRVFKQFDRYAQVQKEWLLMTGLDELNIEFIWIGMVIGSLGNHFEINKLLKANQYGLRPAKKPYLLLPEGAQLRNPALFSYFEPHLCVIREAEAIQSLKSLETLLTLPLGTGITLHHGFSHLYIGANQIEMEREKLDMDPSFFKLSDRHREMGLQALKQLGVPGDAWYVTLHVREPSYRGERRENTTENFRNANPLDYIKAIKAVTKAGGWVFRMGDPLMTPLPKMPQVIDYALNEIRCDWMDVFLGSTCKFVIGTGSGYYTIPALFGVPYIFTNFPVFAPYFEMKNFDLYLPRWLKKVQTEKLVSFEDYMSPRITMFYSSKSFRDAGLAWVKNTPEELEAVNKEMLERTNCDLPSRILDDDLQSRFKKLVENSGQKYGGRTVKAFATISQDFLERNAYLLEC